jgi:hypothetical protein
LNLELLNFELPVRVERSERNVAIDNICRIAWALGVHAFDLLKD